MCASSITRMRFVILCIDSEGIAIITVWNNSGLTFTRSTDLPYMLHATLPYVAVITIDVVTTVATMDRFILPLTSLGLFLCPFPPFFSTTVSRSFDFPPLLDNVVLSFPLYYLFVVKISVSVAFPTLIAEFAG